MKLKKKRLLKFAVFDKETKSYSISLPLIGQLGKNYTNGYDKINYGRYIIKFACDKIREAQELMGGRFVFLECEDKPELKEFYESNGFVCFGKRKP